MRRRTPTPREVAAAYRHKFAHELRTEWAVALIYRPISFMLTPLFAACAVPPAGVTLLGLACALLLPYFAISGGAAAWAWVGAFALAFSILDCVDGDLARVTGHASRRGGYADFITDLVYRTALYASIGILVDRTAPLDTIAGLGAVRSFSAGVVTALLCVVLALVAKVGRLHVEACERDTGNAPAPPAQQVSVGDIAIAFLSGLDHLLPCGVLVFGAVGRLDWLLAYLVVFSLGDFLLTQRSAWARLR